MRVSPSEYGAAGVVGIGTPQANPTVEPEMNLLRPDGMTLLSARLYSPLPDARARLVEYIERLDETLARFGSLALDAFGFACTGSSYLVGAEAERALVGRLEARFGYPVITAASAVHDALAAIGARRILFVAPYPDWLAQPGAAHWRALGFDVVGLEQIRLPGTDTRAIYTLTSEHALATLRAAAYQAADAILLSGTGLPSLRAVIAGPAAFGRPVLSSNLCLMWALQKRLGLPVGAPGEDLERWGARVASL